MRQGFTLIELSIVLVIIGLIVGGVLVGQNLISAAAVRAQISQIEKFNTAANTFYGKYGYLPGDIPAAPAAQFGFAPRGQYAGEGDGNGLIEGNYGNCSGCNTGSTWGAGETVMFWEDLSAANLIEGSFTTASETLCPSTVTPTSSPSLSAFFPTAKVGNTNYISVSSNVYGTNPKTNWFSITAIPSLTGCTTPNGDAPGMTVQQAYGMDKKTDDGLPASGNVFLTNEENHTVYTNTGSAVAGSSVTCFDNGYVAGGPMVYSLQQNGAGANCYLLIKIQAGD